MAIITQYRLQLLESRYESDALRHSMIKQMRDMLASAPVEEVCSNLDTVMYTRLKSPYDYYFKRISDRYTQYVMTRYAPLFDKTIDRTQLELDN